MKRGIFGSKKKHGAVFGVALAEVVKTESTRLVPGVVMDAIRALELHGGLKQEGIFRKCASTVEVDKLKKLYDENATTEQKNTALSAADPVTVSGLLKLYLRELPEPLLTKKLYDLFVDAGTNDDAGERIANLRLLLKALPPANRAVLRELLGFLRKVSANSGVNRMTDENLAIVFGPTLLSTEDTSRVLSDSQGVISVVQMFLTSYDSLFDDSSPAGICRTPSKFFAAVSPAVSPSSAVAVSNQQQPPQQAVACVQEQSPLSAKASEVARRTVCSQLGSPSTSPAAASVRTAATAERVRLAECAGATHECVADEGGKEAKENIPAEQPTEDSSRRASKKRRSDDGSSVVTSVRQEDESFAAGAEDTTQCEGSGMTLEQAMEAKDEVKRILVAFDARFFEEFGRKPTNKEKEPVRAHYKEYNRLQREVERLAALADDSELPEEYRELSGESIRKECVVLRGEKHRLAAFLRKWTAEFERVNRRPVMSEVDRRPVAMEYRKYKDIKHTISRLERYLIENAPSAPV